MPIAPPIRSAARACAALALLSLPACTPPRPEQVTIPFDRFRVDVPAGGAVANLDQTVMIYGGRRVTDFTLTLEVANLAAGSLVEVQSGSGAVLQTITGNGTVVTPAVGGNVGRIRVRVPVAAPRAPDVRVVSINTTRLERFVQPVVEPAVANTVSSFPLTLGQPVDFALHDMKTEHFHFTVGGLAGREFDIILIGAATTWIADPAHGFPLDPTDPMMEAFTPLRPDSLPLTLPPAMIARFPATDRDSLRITVTNAGLRRENGVRDPFHARLVVVPAGTAQRLAFPSTEPMAFFPWPVGVDTDGTAAANPTMQTKLNCTNYAGTSAVTNVSVPVPGFAAPPVVPVIRPVCYDGHSGSDFLLAPGAMDADVPVTAAASGIVVETRTGNVDTCFADPRNNLDVTCPGTDTLIANFVLVRQDDGRFARYYHLRNQVLPVAPGDRVACGQVLGNTGSSGISALPHVHFELRSLTPQAAGPFLAPPSLDAAIGQNGTVIDPYPDQWRRTLPGNVPLPACS